MTKKRKQIERSVVDHDVSTTADSPRRPRVLGFIILAAGGFSSWYWYKPLPDSAKEAAYSVWQSHPNSEGHWTNTELIRPTLEESEVESVSESGSTSGELIADNSLPNLIPVPATRRDLDSILASEKIPTFPGVTQADARGVVPTEPWTETKINSKLTGQTKPKNEWPDLGFVPQKVKPEAKTPFAPPGLLESSTKTSESRDGRVRIRTLEEDNERGAHFPSPVSAQNPDAVNAIQDNLPPPSYIRQPKR